MTATLRAFVLFILPLWAISTSFGQTLSGPGGPKGGGTFGDCDSSLVVDFEVTPLGGLMQQFTALVEPGATVSAELTWTYFTGEIEQAYGMQPQVSYPAPGEFPICLTVNAFDLNTSSLCHTTTCRFIDILQDPSCQMYDPDFTISSVDGTTIGFEALMSLDSLSVIWNFGAGQINIGSSPQHTFEGPGPHEICLTVVGPSPVNCTATVCKWLYLGPANVECSTVLDPGFLFFQLDNIVVVLDTSMVTGQYSTVHWDFGDGTTAEGRVAVHAYPPFGDIYQLCSTLELWGPLVSDTCVASHCISVGSSLTSVEEHERSELSIWPNPAVESIRATGLGPGPAEVSIHDALGRQVISHMVTPANGEIQIALDGLGAGIYTLRCRQQGAVFIGRFVKE